MKDEQETKVEYSRELNSYKVDNNILKSKPTFKDLEEMIDKREVVEKKAFKPKDKQQSKNQGMER